MLPSLEEIHCAGQVCKCLRFSGVGVPREYETGFQRALWTFRHQRVFCPAERKLVHLRPLPPGGLADGVLVLAALPSKGEADLPFLGPVLPNAMTEAIAIGGAFKLPLFGILPLHVPVV